MAMSPKQFSPLSRTNLLLAIALALSLNDHSVSAQIVQTPPQAQQPERSSSPPLVAQVPPDISQRDLPQNPIPRLIPPNPPQPSPLPQTLPPTLPPPEDLLRPPVSPPLEPGVSPGEIPQTVDVQQFKVKGSTVFDPDTLAALAWQAATSTKEIPALLDSYCSSPADRCCPRNIKAEQEYPQQPIPLSFEQLLRARSAITQLYLNCGYITSGAILPPQTPIDQNNIVTIQVVEGSLEEINVAGTRRLNRSYIRSRLAIATTPPLQRQRLLQALQLLQLNSLLRRISANLQAGTRPGTNILQVDVTEADSFRTTLILDNNRSPSVGSFERGIEFEQANLSGLGDNLNATYLNTDGSNEVVANYTIPINPRNGTIDLNYQYTHSNVIEEPFDVLGIEGNTTYYNVTFRQPLVQTPNEEFALGLTFSREESQTSLSIDDIGPFPLSPGADDNGSTRVSALRFFQDYSRQTPRQVLAARSQFSLGLGLFDATINEVPPDSRFFSWLGQAQYVRQLDNRGTLLLARANAQLTPDSLVSMEQFGIGGLYSVRGYRYDTLLTDNGIFASLELQFPILRVRQLQGRLFVVPFIDAGTGWNVSSPDPNPNTLVSTGLGLVWRQANGNLSAQLYFGIPLISVDNQGDTWQANGVSFSIQYSPF
jgi:hemolysin activation/secretion protein